MPNDEVGLVDHWGVKAGMPSRTAAIRYLIQQGLEKEKASGNGLQATPDASAQ